MQKKYLFILSLLVCWVGVSQTQAVTSWGASGDTKEIELTDPYADRLNSLLCYDSDMEGDEGDGLYSFAPKELPGVTLSYDSKVDCVRFSCKKEGCIALSLCLQALPTVLCSSLGYPIDIDRDIQAIEVEGEVHLEAEDAATATQFFAAHPGITLQVAQGSARPTRLTLKATKQQLDRAVESPNLLLTDEKIQGLLKQSWFQALCEGSELNLCFSGLYSGRCELSDSALAQLVSAFPNLEKFWLSGSPISDTCIKMCLKGRKRTKPLKHLALISCPNLTAAILEDVCQLKGLESLHLEGHTGLHWAQAKDIPSSLTHVHLENIHVEDAALMDILEGCKHLKRLELFACPGVSDKSIQAITQDQRNLKSLHLKDLSALTEEALMLLFNETKLQDLCFYEKTSKSWPAAERLIGKWTHNRRTLQYDYKN